MNKKRMMLVVIVIALLAGAAVTTAFLVELRAYKQEMASLKIYDVDLSEAKDGTYEGSYDAKLVRAKVLVEIKDHEIRDIEILEHENGRGKPAEAILTEVITAQSLEVEAVSGATNSSKILLKSIELAIESASKGK